MSEVHAPVNSQRRVTNLGLGEDGLARAWQRHSALAWTLVAAFAGQGFLILSGIVAARLLGPEDRGHLQLFLLAPALVGQIGIFGLPAAVTYYVSRDPESSGAIWSQLVRLVALLTLALTVTMGLIVFAALSGASPALQASGLIVVFAVPGIVAQRFGLALLQGQQRFRPFNVFRNLQVAAYAIAAVTLFFAGIESIVLVTAVWTAATIASGGVTLLFALTTQKTRGPSQTDVREMARFGSKSLVGNLSPIEILRLDQIALAIVAGPVALGIYVVGWAFSNLPRFIAQSIGMVAYPRISSSRRRVYRQAANYVLAVGALSGAIVVSMAVLAPWLVPLFFGSEYAESVAVTRITLLAAFLLSLRRILTDCATGYGWPAIGSRAEAVSSAIAILLVLALGARWGAAGASWGLAAGAAAGLATVLALLRYEIRANRHDEAPSFIGITPIANPKLEAED